MTSYKIVELHGDGIAAELSAAVHEVARALPCQLEFLSVDLGQAQREKRGDELYDEAEALMREHRVSLKYPTATTAESPNKILRDRLDFAVIHRPVVTIPSIRTNFTKSIDIDIVRIGTGGTYEDSGRRLGHDVAVSLRVIQRVPSTHAARFAFELARQRKSSVVSASKYTIQRETDGLFEECCANVSRDFRDVPHRRELFDSMLAGIIMNPERYAVIVTPNEYGDFLSDMCCGLIGSIALGDSASYAFDLHSGAVIAAMFDPAGGTAPDIAGSNKANPFAAFFALASLLRFLGEVETSTRLRQSVLACLAAGEKTADVGGKLGTREFTQAVIARLK
ncbi:MAG TPA: isocitrate/isopropylmalate family dehydrogenase [Planctomycetota bacterium]|nr:isocitrate/isopropylmalate family dehydrogenase [Planctomycetota bacterium]